MRVTLPTLPASRSSRYIAVASPSSVGLVARMTSTNGVLGCGLVDPRQQLGDLQPVRPHPIDR